MFQDGRTALYYAAQNGYADVCKLLIEKGCELDVQDAVSLSVKLALSLFLSDAFSFFYLFISVCVCLSVFLL